MLLSKATYISFQLQFYILSALAFPGNRTHDLGIASAMFYHLSYRYRKPASAGAWLNLQQQEANVSLLFRPSDCLEICLLLMAHLVIGTSVGCNAFRARKISKSLVALRAGTLQILVARKLI